jgi:hypothetical protein
MIDFKEIGEDGEKWELLARDFFAQLGFIIESPPDRGPDAGKDLLISESIEGKLNHYPFKWLVSCKNNIISGKSVNEKQDENNILERCKVFRADGFIGFYSTLSSSGLNTRLRQLKDNQEIKDYKIFDYKLIENYIIEYGFSQIFLRYFPKSYKNVRPIHKIFDQLIELRCDYCGKDILQDLYKDNYNAIAGTAYSCEGDKQIFHDVYFACKHDCDNHMEYKMKKHGWSTLWEDITDIAKPNFYLRYILATINQLSDPEHYEYKQTALKKERMLLMALAQKVFHEVTDEERERFNELLETGLY